MALTFYWRAENSTTLDGTHDYSANDTTATNSSASFSGSAAYKGSYGILVPASTTSSYRFLSPDIINNDTDPPNSVGSAAFMIKFPNAVHTTEGIWFGFRAVNVSATSDVIQTTSGVDNGSNYTKLRLQIGKDGVGYLNLETPTYCMTSDVWYGVVVRWDIPNDKRAIEVYSSSGTLIDSNEDTTTNLGAIAPTVLTSLYWGRSAGHAQDVYIDNMLVANAYDAPLQNNVWSISSATEYSESTGIATPTMGRCVYILP